MIAVAILTTIGVLHLKALLLTMAALIAAIAIVVLFEVLGHLTIKLMEHSDRKWAELIAEDEDDYDDEFEDVVLDANTAAKILYFK